MVQSFCQNENLTTQSQGWAARRAMEILLDIWKAGQRVSTLLWHWSDQLTTHYLKENWFMNTKNTTRDTTKSDAAACCAEFPDVTFHKHKPSTTIVFTLTAVQSRSQSKLLVSMNFVSHLLYMLGWKCLIEVNLVPLNENHDFLSICNLRFSIHCAYMLWHDCNLLAGRNYTFNNVHTNVTHLRMMFKGILRIFQPGP